MKAIKVFAIVALAAGLLSCQQDIYDTDPNELLDVDKVEVTFSVQFPEPIPVWTKAPMGENPLADEAFDLYLCLYGAGDGYVQNWIPATEISKTVVDGYITGGSFKALLPLSDERRVIHFIANPPERLISTPPLSAYMDDVMRLMVDTNNECSYWQQVELPHIKLSSDGVTADPTSVSPLQNGIHLVRNYTKIIVSSARPQNTQGPHPGYEPHKDNFDVLQWALINVPDRGYVAPYTENPQNRFPSGYLNINNYSGEGTLYRQLALSDKYPGSIPPGAVIDDSYPGDPSTTNTAYVGSGEALYMYERPIPTVEQIMTSILVQIRFNESHDLVRPRPGEPHVTEKIYWYKIEVIDNDGEYFPFLRDLVYHIRLKGITEAGYATAQEAYNGRSFGNICASIETASLAELSNGTSVIHVDVMDYTFLTGGETLYLDNGDGETPARFWFSPDNGVHQYHQSQGNIPGTPGQECTIQVTLQEVDGYEPAVSVATPDANGQIQITLNETADAIKKSIIHVAGKNGRPEGPGQWLYRDITVNLMKKQDFVHNSVATAITNNPDVTRTDQPVEFLLQIPEGLGASVFPIQVRIEAEKNTLSARTNDLPASTGVSAFDNTRNSFYYIYSISYDDYRSYDSDTGSYVYTYEFPFTLYTNNRTDNSTRIKISDLAGKFNTMDLVLGTVNP